MNISCATGTLCILHSLAQTQHTLTVSGQVEKTDEFKKYKDDKMEIVEISERTDLLDKAVDYFWKCWGNEHNFKFYQDCIVNSIDKKKSLPKFYIVLNDNEIIASYALLTNDIISRQDLYPWFACLYVNPEHRNKGIAGQLLDDGLSQTNSKGFTRLYLSTDLENFYEKKGWEFYATGFNLDDSTIKIYVNQLNKCLKIIVLD